MAYKYDFSDLSDYEVERRYEQLSHDLESKTYWYAEEVHRDQNQWSQLRDEMKRRLKNDC